MALRAVELCVHILMVPPSSNHYGKCAVIDNHSVVITIIVVDNNLRMCTTVTITSHMVTCWDITITFQDEDVTCEDKVNILNIIIVG